VHASPGPPLDRAAAEDWIRARVEPVGAIEVAHVRPWSTVLRVPLADGAAWFKACAPVQAFEPRLSASLFRRWPDRVPEVLDHDEARAWLLLADAGTTLGAQGNPPEAWLRVLPGYAELQLGEAERVAEHLMFGVPDLRLPTLPNRYAELLEHELPIDPGEMERLREFAPRFGELCAELATHAIPESVQHDDLHYANVYVQGECLRVLDWGDASISHPFASLIETFRFLELAPNRLAPSDPWFARLRDAYLEPWGQGLTETFALAMRVGTFAHTCAWARQRDALPHEARLEFDRAFGTILRRAITLTVD